MCFGAEAVWAPALVTAALGAGTTAYATDQAAKKQDSAVARGIAERANIQRQAGNSVNKQIQTIAGSTPEMERKAAQNDFMEALRKSKTADGSQDIGGPAGASDRFASDVVNARAGATTEGRELAGNLARIDAPQFQRQREAVGIANTGVDLSLLDKNAQAVDFLSQLRASRAGQVDPLLSGVGQGLSAFGQAYAGRHVNPRLGRPPPLTAGEFPTAPRLRGP